MTAQTINLSAMTMEEKLDLLERLSNDVQYADVIPEKMVDAHEEFWMDLVNRIIPEMKMANYKALYDTLATEKGY